MLSEMSFGSVAKEESDKRWLILRAKVYEEKIKAAFRYFRENGVEPIMIKGWAAADEYPEKYQRFFGDIDFCVAPHDFEKSRRLVEAEEGRKLTIDLHCGLRHLDTLEWEDLFENSVLKMLDDERIRVLRPEDHLRVLCVHWLTDGGAEKEKLLDIFYVLKNHQNDFDWDRCLGRISQTRRGWIVKTIGAVHRYFDFNVSELPFAEESKELPRWFVEELEAEWASDARLVPIHTTLRDRREFWKQLKKRFPPNAIQATVDMEGKFDDSSRVFYQFGSILLRLKPSIKRVVEAIGIFLNLKKGK